MCATLGEQHIYKIYKYHGHELGLMASTDATTTSPYHLRSTAIIYGLPLTMQPLTSIWAIIGSRVGPVENTTFSEYAGNKNQKVPTAKNFYNYSYVYVKSSDFKTTLRRKQH